MDQQPNGSATRPRFRVGLEEFSDAIDQVRQMVQEMEVDGELLGPDADDIHAVIVGSGNSPGELVVGLVVGLYIAEARDAAKAVPDDGR